MKRTLTRDFYMPKDYTYTEYPEVNLLIGVGEKAAICFGGKRSKPDWHYTFRSNDRRDEKIKEAIENARKIQEWKAQRKAENKGKLSTSAATAVEIRKALKKAFPGVKFSVRSETFSMGNSVDIRWTDGPMKELVESIAEMFQYGRFDSMQDLSYNVSIDKRLNCQGAKYVHVNRQLSESYKNQILNILEKHYVKGQWGFFAPWQWTEAELILLGKNKDWLTIECVRLKELVLGGPVNQPNEDQIPKNSDKSAVTKQENKPVKLAKVIPFPVKQKPLSATIAEVKNAINPEITAIVLEAIKEVYPEKIANMSEEQAILFAASLVAEMKNEYKLNL